MMNAKKVSLLGALALLLSACGPKYDRLELTAEKSSPLGGQVRTNQITVPEGMIVKTHVAPYNDDNELMGTRVESRDPDTLEVVNVVNDRDFAFVGKKVGQTEIVFKANEEIVLVVAAEVTVQPAPGE